MYDQALYDRLTSRIRKDEATGCWLWTGSWWKNRPHPGNRYGYISVKCPDGRWRGKNTHRLMMIALVGPLPPEQCVCHKCDVPLCINPDHLFIGTMKDNIWDSRRKGRHYESRRDHCERGHPLFGDNLYVYPKNGTRHCKTCQRGRERIKVGWPEELAYSIPSAPHGFQLVRVFRYVESGHSAQAESSK